MNVSCNDILLVGDDDISISTHTILSMFRSINDNNNLLQQFVFIMIDNDDDDEIDQWKEQPKR